MKTRTGYPAAAGVCPECGRETGNLAVHLRACKGAQITLSPADRVAIERAAAHAVAPALLPEAGRLEGTVTDLDIARLVRVLEAGGEVFQGGTGWTTNSPLLPKGRLTTITGEALRLGIVSAASEPAGPGVRKIWIVPAIVHLKPFPAALVPPCKPHVLPGVKRYRMLADPALVDCLACLSSGS
jgi:hypothetical protein